MTRSRRGGVKRRETNLSINHFHGPDCVLHSPEHPERFTALSREENGEGRDRGDLGDKRESQKGESNQASNHTPK